MKLPHKTQNSDYHNNGKRLLVLLASLSTISACSNLADGLAHGSSPDKSTAPATEALEQLYEETTMSNASARMSKYSLSKSTWSTDKEPAIGKSNALFGGDPQLGIQSSYRSYNSRSHLIDHFIDNSRPDLIPLNSWKNDFIAGELALDNLDYSEAEAMFQLALQEAQKQSVAIEKINTALVKLRLALVARKKDNPARAENLYKEALVTLKPYREYSRQTDCALYELALLSWQHNRFEESENYLRERLHLQEMQFGTMGTLNGTLNNDLANALYYQHKFKDAEKYYQRAYTMAYRFRAGSDNTQLAAYNLANCAFELQQYADAEALYRSLNSASRYQTRIEACQRELSKKPSNSASSIIPSKSADHTVWAELLKTAQVLIKKGATWEAGTVLQATECEATGLTEPVKERALAETKLCQGDYIFAQGNLDEAIQRYSEALHWCDEMKDGEASKKNSIIAYLNLQIFLCNTATNRLQQAQASASQLKLKDSNIIHASIISLDQILDHRRIRGDNEEQNSLLVPVFKASTSIAEKIDDKHLRALALFNQARFEQLRRHEDANSFFDKALRLSNTETDEFKLKLNTAAALSYMQTSQYQAAEDCLISSLKVAEADPTENQRKLRQTVGYLRSLYSNWHKPEMEEQYLLRSIELSKIYDSPSFIKGNIPNNLIDLAHISLAKGDTERAFRYLEKAAELQSQEQGRELQTLNELVALYENSGFWSKAAETYQKLARAVGGLAASEQARLPLYKSAICLLKTGKYQEARSLLQSLVEDMESHNQAKDYDYGCYRKEPQYTVCLQLLGNILMDEQQNYDSAISKFDRAFKTNPANNNLGPTSNKTGTAEPAKDQEPNVTVDQQVNYLVCCDNIGNRERADKFRRPLLVRIEQVIARNNQPATETKTSHQEPTNSSPIKSELSANQAQANKQTNKQAKSGPKTAITY